MSTAPKAAAFALLIRLLYGSFPALQPLWIPLLWIVAILSMTIGNLAALRQENVKRMLAYSSIAHAGYLLAAFAGLGFTGIAAASFYIAAYAAMNFGIFAVVSVVSGYEEKLPLAADYRGLLYRAPLLGSLLLFFLTSLIGIPFTAGFFGKFYSFSTALQGGAVWLGLIGLLNSGLAAAYYLRLAITVAQPPLANTPQPPSPKIGIAVGAALAFSALTTVILGVAPTRFLTAAQAGAAAFAHPPVAAAPDESMPTPANVQWVR
jgi:NADH-quinone oxidoreductase subunit N